MNNLKKMLQTGFAVIFGILFVSQASATEMDVSLSDILKIKINVASGKKSLTQRESPAIVTIITAEDIKRSGARDMIDVMRLVPGYEVMHDLANAVSLGIRGNWASEGKVLLLVDGIEMNEQAFLSYQYGHHLPVDMIERIEIIRGPGSAMYGGSAELGVISIISKAPDQTFEGMASAQIGRMVDETGRTEGSVYLGRQLENFSLSGFVHNGKGIRSDKTATDFYGDTYKMGDDDNSNLEATFANIGIEFYDLSARLIIDNYDYDYYYSASAMVNSGYDPDDPLSDYQSYNEAKRFEIKYDLKLGDDLVITPKYTYSWDKSWVREELLTDSGVRITDWESDDSAVKKNEGDISASYDLTEKNNLSGGMVFSKTKLNESDFQSYSLYAQGLFNTEVGNFTIGGRYTDHEEYGSSFVPRAAYTRVLGTLHFKLLYSEALREPSISNIDYNSDIEPEETTVYEIEVGKQLAEKWIVTANIFDIDIEDVIIYSYDGATDEDSYINFGKTGTRGFEFAGKYTNPKGFFNSFDLNYSYAVISENTVTNYYAYSLNYESSEVDDQNLGFPMHKVTAKAVINPYDSFYISPSVLWFSSRYATTGVTSDWWYLTYEKLDATWLANIAFTYDNLFIEDMDLSLSIFNMFDEDYDFVEPYDGWEAPMPDASREFVLKVTYEF